MLGKNEKAIMNDYTMIDNLSVFSDMIEPVERVLAAEVQEQQRMAEALGGLHKLLSLLLQEPSGTTPHLYYTYGQFHINGSTNQRFWDLI